MSDDLVTPQPVDTPLSYVPPPYVPPPRSSLGPLFLGFFLVVFVAGVIAVAYYFSRFRALPSLSPSPTPTATATATATPLASPEPSDEGASALPSLKPVSAILPGPSPTPFSLPSLDLRFGNPSARVKQTIDEGTGDGRVINREYTSIQAGQFDEVASSWSPKVTVCFHLVSGEAIAGKLIKFSMLFDDKTQVEDTMSWIDTLEAGKIYDWCHDVTTDLGKHTARLTINTDKSVKESNYANDLATITFENLADNVAPNFALTGPTQEDAGSCLSASYVSDNVTPLTSLKFERKLDGGNWETTTDLKYCLGGTSGSEHTYSFRVTDARGNSLEQKKTFNLF